MTPSEYKKLKGLKRQNLRDHMNDLELIFNMLGERVTTEISQQENPDTFVKNKKVAKKRRWYCRKCPQTNRKRIGQADYIKRKLFAKTRRKEKVEIRIDALPNLNGRQ
jgi:hypothetical protein